MTKKTKKDRQGLSFALLKMLLIIPMLFRLTGNVLSFARWELLALRRKMIFLVMLTMISFILLLGVWVCGNILLLLYCLSLSVGLMACVAILMAINLLLLVTVYLMMSLIKVDLSFSETRRIIRSLGL